MWSDSPRNELLVRACGIFGPAMLAAYFGAPLLLASPLARLIYSAHPTTAQVIDIGKQYHELIYAGCWLQATGALLAVIFFMALVNLASKANPLAGRITAVGSAVLLSVALAEVVFSLTWAAAAVTGRVDTSRVSFDVTSSFVRVYPLIPAPAIYLSLGVLLLGKTVLPQAFARLALALGGAFTVAGVVGILVPAAAAATAALSAIQVLWIVGAAITLRATGSPRPTVAANTLLR